MTLPREWVRGPQWASEAARCAWGPVLHRGQTAWQELEIASVTEGLRAAALIRLQPEEVPPASRDCASVGLELSVLAMAPGAGAFRAAVHRPGMGTAWHRAWSSGDDEAIGQMLGFPACCRTFFLATWATGSCDVTPAMATIEGPWEASIMLRWLGVRLVPHLPCSGACEETVRQARAYLEAGRRIGVDVEAIEALLRLPVSYSSLHGVTIVETPVCRFMAGADPAPDEVRRVRAGEVALPPPRVPDSWQDNGFTSRAAMDLAHGVVASVASAGVALHSALDLGAGDGALLARLSSRGGGRWVGVEADEGRAARGCARHPGVQVLRGRLEDPEGLAEAAADPADVALLMPGRLLELPPQAAGLVREMLPRVARRLVVYAYADQLARHGGLARLAAGAGLELLGPAHAGPGVEAAEGRVA